MTLLPRSIAAALIGVHPSRLAQPDMERRLQPEIIVGAGGPQRLYRADSLRAEIQRRAPTKKGTR